MSNDLSHAIDVDQAALQGRVFSASIPLARFARVVEAAVDDQGEVQAELRFERDAAGRNLVSGRLRADIALQCQRCLRRMGHTVDSSFRVVLVGDERRAGKMAADVETWVVADRQLDAMLLLEDELLLSLPIVPRHENTQCRAPAMAPGTGAEREESRAESPFAVLRTLSSAKTRENH